MGSPILWWGIQEQHSLWWASFGGINQAENCCQRFLHNWSEWVPFVHPPWYKYVWNIFDACLVENTRNHRSSWCLIIDGWCCPCARQGNQVVSSFGIFQQQHSFFIPSMQKEAFQELWSLFIHICPGYDMFQNAREQRKAFFSYFSIFCHYRLIWFPGRRQIQSLWRQMMTLVWEEPAQVSKSANSD